MKAIRIETTGGPEVLRYADIELAPPGPGQVRLKHTAIGVNFLDTYQRSGLYPVALPVTLGGEAAGVVESVGAGVTRFKPGDRAGFCTYGGGYAQASNVPEDRLIHLPDSVAGDVAAAAMLKGMTAQFLLKRTFAVQPGQTILYHAAAGGVGTIACQWAKHLGATVIGTVGSGEKKALAIENGCAHVFNTRSENWVEGVRGLTGGAGVPVVYDSIGKDTFEGSLDCLSVRGLMVSFGNASGPVPPFAPSLLSQKGSLYLTRPTLFHYARDATELQATADDLFAALAAGIVKIQINQRFALKDAAAAHQALHSRTTTGATILVP